MPESTDLNPSPESPPPAYSYNNPHSDDDDDDDDLSSLASDEDDNNDHRQRTPAEIAQRDRDFLAEEEEKEQLLMRGGQDAPAQSSFLSRMSDRRDARKQRRAEKRLKKASRRDGGQERKELIYDTEQGGRASTSGESESSESADVQHHIATHTDRKRISSRRSKRIRAAVYVLIAVFFLVIGFGAWQASTIAKRPPVTDDLLSNGTSLFAKTTVVISLDGFRADYLQRGITPELNKFVREGVSPLFMTPSFPSVTFPNHYTLVTGLYPESHGVVGNSFWAPEFDEMFYYTDPKHSLQPKWWSNEPLWVTAEEQNVRTAIHMWPGSEAHIGSREPTYVDKFNGHEILERKHDRILELLDKPGPWDKGASTADPRPQFIAAYVPNVDQDGHLHGPNSTEIDQTISKADGFIKFVMAGLEERNLTNIVNVVVVSDHGMATTSVDRILQLEELIDPELIREIDGWPHYGLRPKNPDDLQSMYDSLKAKADSIDAIDVYLRDVNMPERFHFQNNDRIAPLWIMPRTGWAIATLDEFNVEEAKKNGDVYHPRGIHGYDHEHPLMRSIFIARGPAFPHEPGSRLEDFQNINVYNILCDSIGVEPMPNNGTLRLPLKPIGVHAADHPATEEDHSHKLTDEVSETPPTATQITNDGQYRPHPPTPADSDTQPSETPDSDDDDASNRLHELWKWIQIESGELKEWFHHLVEGHRHHDDQDAQSGPQEVPPRA